MASLLTWQPNNNQQPPYRANTATDLFNGIDQHGVVHIYNELKESEYSEYQGVVIASSLLEDTIENLKNRFVEYSEKNGLN